MYLVWSQINIYHIPGISVNLYALKMLYSGESCYVGITHIVLSLSMYTSYCILFCNFFIKTYLTKPKEKVCWKKTYSRPLFTGMLGGKSFSGKSVCPHIRIIF